MSDPSQAGLGFFEINSAVAERRLTETDAFSLTVNWNPNENYVVTSITTFDDGAAVNPDDGSGTLDQAVGSVFSVESEQFAQDLRIASNLDGPFDFVAGLYYYREELANTHESYLFLDIDFNLDGAVDFNDCFDPMAVAFGLPPSPGGAATEALFNSLGFSLAGFATLGCNAKNSFTQDKTSTAAYFDGSYELTDALLLRYGVRYTRDDAEQNRFNAHLAGADDVPVFGTINGGSADPLATISGPDFSDSEVTGRIGLDYTMPNGTLFYGSFNRGYRGGAFNAQAYYDPGEVSMADPEFLDSFEVGFKSTLWDGRVRLNGAAFFYNYESQQVISIDTTTFVQTLINLDESEIRGLEVEAAAQLSPAVLVQLGIGVLRTEIKKGILGGDDLSGEDLPGSPELNANAAVDWDLFSTENGRLTLHLDATYQDETLYAFGAGKGDSYAVFNGRLSFAALDERWGVSVWGRNLSDEEYYSFWADARATIGYVLSLIHI